MHLLTLKVYWRYNDILKSFVHYLIPWIQIISAELGSFFLIGTVISLLMLLASDNISHSQVQLTLPLLPAVLVGFSLSRWLDKRFKQHYLKPSIAVLSLSSSIIILAQTSKAL